MVLENSKLKYSTPEEQGISSEHILEFLEAVEANNVNNTVDLHSFQLIRHDCIIAEGAAKGFGLDRFHRIYSAAKGIISLGVMLVLQEGLLSLDEKVVDIFADYLPDELNEKMKEVTVYHLLTMSIGNEVDSCVAMFQSDNWFQTFLSSIPVNEPGSRFFYDNGVPHMLAAIVEKKTGEDIITYMKPRMLDPMGVQVLCRYNQLGEREPSTVCVRQTDLTKFGYLMLQEGNWNGVQLLKPEICRLYSKFHVSTKHHKNECRRYGYGFQVWKLPCEGFVFAGGNDNHSIVFTEADMVFSCMANNKVKDTFSLQQTFYEYVYLRMREKPLPPNPEAYERLKRKLSAWNLAPSGSDRSSKAAEVQDRNYVLEENPFDCNDVKFHFDEPNNTVWVTTSFDDGRQSTFGVGLSGNWVESDDYLIIPINLTHGNFIDGEDQTKQMGSGAWIDKDTFLVYGRSLGRVATDQFRFTFQDDQLLIRVQTPALALPGCAVNKKQGEFVLKGRCR